MLADYHEHFVCLTPTGSDLRPLLESLLQQNSTVCIDARQKSTAKHTLRILSIAFLVNTISICGELVLMAGVVEGRNLMNPIWSGIFGSSFWRLLQKPIWLPPNARACRQSEVSSNSLVSMPADLAAYVHAPSLTHSFPRKFGGYYSAIEVQEHGPGLDW